ncbi:hypothetical protein [Streptomyces sp. KLOTTS4A1]|uniref:hypothetical protein n=1 Tax=Streptomyces sp. KLOTTS4A1 TaxID=3390996 RepID=UPI0039F50F89
MAMTLRLPEAEDKILTERALREGKSKQQLAIEAIHRDNQRATLSVHDALDDLMTEHADILDALK